MKNDKLYKSDYKRKKKAINKLRFLLLRVWFYKNWFTLLVVVVGILVGSNNDRNYADQYSYYR